MNITLDNNSMLVLIVVTVLITWTIRHVADAFSGSDDVVIVKRIDELADRIEQATKDATVDLLDALDPLERIEVDAALSASSNAYLAEMERKAQAEEAAEREQEWRAAQPGTAFHHYAEQVAAYSWLRAPEDLEATMRERDGAHPDLILTDDEIDDDVVPGELLEDVDGEDEAIALTKPARSEYRPTDLR